MEDEAVAKDSDEMEMEATSEMETDVDMTLTDANRGLESDPLFVAEGESKIESSLEPNLEPIVKLELMVEPKPVPPLAPISNWPNYPPGGDPNVDTLFPPASLNDFDDEVPQAERVFYLKRYSDLNKVKQARMHCTACSKHLGLSAHNVSRLRMHPLLRTLVCVDCLDFYNSGEFSKGEDGSELYCRWCGQGGQVYCCSSCPTVFCEKCVRRNFGPSKIEDIESIDDWSCFVCSPKALWCHRAALWAARRYCVLKNKYTLSVTDSMKRVKLQRECQIDESVCCKRKTNQKVKSPAVDAKKLVVLEKRPEKQKKINTYEAVKRRSSPVNSKKSQLILGDLSPSISMPPAKKIALSPIANPFPSLFPNKIPIRMPALQKKQVNRRQVSNYKGFNGYVPPAAYGRDCYSNLIPHDNLNLSLESLTQGLDMSMGMQISEDNVVCTPDFPLPIEPVCEVVERDEDCTEVPLKIDDDVQCLTPNMPRIIPKPLSALMSKPNTTLHKAIESLNIIQMTNKDVSVNKVTGGLKFRVDPATLSTSKMYQLPDGRIFAVNMNSKMPGGYSATIVSVNDPSIPLLSRPGLTVKPSSQRPPQSTEKPIRRRRNKSSNSSTPLGSENKSQSSNTFTLRESTMKARINSPKDTTDNGNMSILEKSLKADQKSNSVEWYTYSVCDAVDLVEYVSKKLNKIKNTPTGNLRNKTIQEMKELHYTLEHMLKISCQRFQEVRDNLNNEFKLWLKDKCSIELFSDEGEDDDRVEITSDDRFTEKSTNAISKSCDEPIFIDENSNDSVKNTNQDASNIDQDTLIKIDSVVSNVCPGSDTDMEYVINEKKDSEKENESEGAEKLGSEKEDEEKQMEKSDSDKEDETDKLDENLGDEILNEDSKNKSDSCDSVSAETTDLLPLEDPKEVESIFKSATEESPSIANLINDTDNFLLDDEINNHDSKCDNGDLDDLLNDEDNADIIHNNSDKNSSIIDDNHKDNEASNPELDENDISNDGCVRPDKCLTEVDNVNEISPADNIIALDSSFEVN